MVDFQIIERAQFAALVAETAMRPCAVLYVPISAESDGAKEARIQLKT